MQTCKDCHRPADAARCSLCTRIRRLEGLVLPFGTKPDMAAEFCGLTGADNVDRLAAELLLLYAKKGLLMASKHSQLTDRELAWLEKAIASLAATSLSEHSQWLSEDVEEADRSR